MNDERKSHLDVELPKLYANGGVKPWGIWSTHAGIPDGASFALLEDTATDAELRWARDYASGRLAAGKPFAWVLYTRPEAKAMTWVPALRKRLDAAGVTGAVAAMCWREEWFHGLATVAEIDARCAYVGQQHAVLKEYFPHAATVTVNAFTSPATEFGAAYYSPEPAHTDIRGAYTYVPAGQTWASGLNEHKLRLSCGYRVGAYQLPRKPVALIAQAFTSVHDPGWAAWPTAETIAHTARWAQHPAVLAVWPFDFATYRNGAGVATITGWMDWPEASRVMPAWGVQ